MILKVQVIVYCPEPELMFLLLRRGPERGRIWQPVTGKVEPGDADLAAAAARELAEETGIEGARLFDTGVEFRFEKDGGTVAERLFRAELDAPEPVRLSGEHVEYAWRDAGEAAVLLDWPIHRTGVDRVRAVVESGGQSTP